MAQTIWHNVPAQILLHLQVVCSILLSALPIKTDYLRDPYCMLKISTQSAEGVYKVNTDNKTQRTARKSIKNSDGNRCQIVYAFLFDLFFCVTSNVGVMFSEADSDCLSIVGTALTHQKHT